MKNHPDRELISEALHRRHAIAAGIAAALSALLHIGLVLWLLVTPLRWTLTNLRHTPEDRRREPIQVTQGPSDAVWTEAMRALTEGDRPVTQMSPDMQTQVGALEVPPAVGGMAPAPVDPAAVGSPPEPALEPTPSEPPPVWQPREEIIQLSDAAIREALPELERIRIPEVDRAHGAPDVLPPVDARLVDEAPVAPSPIAGGTPLSAPTPIAIPGLLQTAAPVDLGLEMPELKSAPELLSETPQEISPDAPLDHFLKARVFTYKPKRDDHAYFRLEISRAGKDLLPALPKDVLIIQDASGSIAEQRLHFCRQALHQLPDLLGPGDRFNIVRFSDTAFLSFGDWAENTPTSRAIARKFIDRIEAQGQTDMLKSISSVFAVKTVPGRPVIAIVITDGHATSGVLDTSSIIGKFSQANKGTISIFTLGVLSTANRYLLDLVAYCNRGDSRMARGGRWGIPETFAEIMREVAQPTLVDVQFQFAGEDDLDVYPGQTMNLYSDRPLVIFGRYPKTMPNLTFQARGQSGETTGDMVFHLDLAVVEEAGDEAIETDWARQKVYDLIGRYTRTRSPEVLETMRETAHRYNIDIPHRRRLF